MEVLALIPARGGSKRVPNKNLREVGGISLVGKAAQDACRAETVTRVMCSTDSEEIAHEAGRYGAGSSILRPAELAEDHVVTREVEWHVVRHLRKWNDRPPDILVRVQPTSPLRTPADIDACVRAITEDGWSACVSVRPMRDPPEMAARLDEDGRLEMDHLPSVWRRPSQQYRPAYRPNGAVYAARLTYWELQNGDYMGPHTTAYIMPDERSIDIDEPEDLRAARKAAEREYVPGGCAA